MIVRALGRAPAVAGRRALEDLRRTETDPNLKLRLSQALHALDSATGRTDERIEGDRGQVG
jgi:hypothetical protein